MNVLCKKRSTELTPREEFNALVKARDLNKCVFCGDENVEVHHIMDRSLFPDGGYDVKPFLRFKEFDSILCTKEL